MSTEALCRALCLADGADPDEPMTEYDAHWRFYEPQAGAILADPGPPLAALAESGVLTRVTASLPPRSDPMRPRGNGGVYWAAERYVSEWQPDSKWTEVQP